MNAMILLALAATPAFSGDSVGPLARELAAAARSASLKRVAIVGFEPANGRDDGTGTVLAERLTVALARSRGVQTVERRLLPRLMEEHALGRSGALNYPNKLGKVFAVDGLITGTWLPTPRGVRVLARLVQAETGLIVGAAELVLQLDAPPSWSAGDPFDVPIPVLSGIFPGEDPPSKDLFALRDAPAEPVRSCEGAATRVDALEESILDLKARYWALRLKEGLVAGSLRTNPGSTITDPELKARFYARLKAWHASETLPPLAPQEVSRFVQVDGAAFALHRDCAL